MDNVMHSLLMLTAKVIFAVSRGVTHAVGIAIYAIPAALGRESEYCAIPMYTGREVWAGNRYTGEYRLLRLRTRFLSEFRARLYNLVRCPVGEIRVPFTSYREFPVPRWADRMLQGW